MRTLMCCVLLAAASTPASAANFSGRWELQSAAGRGGGRGGPTVLVLNQAGSEVTGTISVRVDAGTNSPINNELWGGIAEGDTVSFYVWTGTDKPTKTTYSGTMAASGDEIAFTVTGGFGGGAPGAGVAQAGRGGQTAAGPTPGGAPGATGQPPAVAPAGRGQSGPQQITAKRAK